MPQQFSEIDHAILKALHAAGRPMPIADLARQINIDQAKVSAACLWFVEQGLLRLKEEQITEIVVGEEGQRLAAEGFPERRALQIINAMGGHVLFGELASALSLDKAGAGEVIKWLLTKKWFEKKEGDLAIAQAGTDALSSEGEDEKLVRHLAAHSPTNLNALKTVGIDGEQALALLKGRARTVKIKERTIRLVQLSEQGTRLIEAGITLEKPEATELTQTMLTTGRWRDVAFKAYDVNLASAPVYAGKSHPLRRIIDETRRCFLEMGFTEIVSPHVECSFWDFDALFQPQDHPAREMQDTFYLRNPRESALPDQETVAAVRTTHETGGITGSLGWRYHWDENKARRNVLRTHVTAASIRHVAGYPLPPQKVFHVGRVFRREKITYKHGAEFVQVDGIIIDANATFATLLGTLAEFYSKMGFRQIKFRPAFFPYTEPSVEVYAFMEKRGSWIEMGGAGVFRPEVTVPFGCPCPVLAWGLGLDRLAMLRIGIDDIRKLYMSDLEWLKGVALCR